MQGNIVRHDLHDSFALQAALQPIGLARFSQVGSITMPHKFVIERNKKGEYVAKFKYNSELIFWTEGYTNKASAKNAIESILKNGPGAPVEEA